YCFHHIPCLHSFPTRRSSDLKGCKGSRITALRDTSKRSVPWLFGSFFCWLPRLQSRSQTPPWNFPKKLACCDFASWGKGGNSTLTSKSRSTPPSTTRKLLIILRNRCD